MRQLYDYKRKMDREARDEQREATIEYYTGMQDPSREAAKADLDKPSKTVAQMKYAGGLRAPAKEHLVI